MLPGPDDGAPRGGGAAGAPGAPGAPDDPDLTTWARGLGAIQEAERLGSARLGTEHLLLASLLDPVTRRLAHDAGLDFSAVQRHLGPPVRVGVGAGTGALPTTEQMYRSDGATRVLSTLRDGAADEPRLTGWVRPDRSTDPRGRSVLRRRLLALLLEDTAPGAARTALDQLATGSRAAWLVEQLNGPDAWGER
ncbi:Clp protease N-terminal domain-containing protein [Actinomycetospora aeridis]|uniref:Clp protease N-terminal domain-containing protein n=1 Tax=Actinomycetospora aeridis TaxID=3129231 RepID=A0ABU8NB48_9PSEU